MTPALADMVGDLFFWSFCCLRLWKREKKVSRHSVGIIVEGDPDVHSDADLHISSLFAFTLQLACFWLSFRSRSVEYLLSCAAPLVLLLLLLLLVMKN